LESTAVLVVDTNEQTNCEKKTQLNANYLSSVIAYSSEWNTDQKITSSA